MLGLPSIAMVGFGLAAVVVRHWRYRIHRAAHRNNAMSPNHVHLALDPVGWADQGKVAISQNRPHRAYQKRAHQDRVWERSAETEEQSEAEIVSINCESQDSTARAAQRRQAFKVISNG